MSTSHFAVHFCYYCALNPLIDPGNPLVEINKIPIKAQ
jgi:hypothetical protein